MCKNVPSDKQASFSACPNGFCANSFYKSNPCLVVGAPTEAHLRGQGDVLLPALPQPGPGPKRSSSACRLVRSWCVRLQTSQCRSCCEYWLLAEACSKKNDFSWRGFPCQKVTDAGTPPARWAQFLSLGLAEQDTLCFYRLHTTLFQGQSCATAF